MKTKINMGNGTSRQQMTNSLGTYWLNLWLWSTHNLFTDHLRPRRRRLCFLPQKHEPTIPISIYLAKQLAARHRPFNVRGGVQHNLGPNKLHGGPKNFTREPTKKVSSCRKLKHTFCVWSTYDWLTNQLSMNGVWTIKSGCVTEYILSKIALEFQPNRARSKRSVEDRTNDECLCSLADPTLTLHTSHCLWPPLEHNSFLT